MCFSGKSTARHLLGCAPCGDLARLCGSFSTLMLVRHESTWTTKASQMCQTMSWQVFTALSCFISCLVKSESCELRRPKYSSSVFFSQGAPPKSFCKFLSSPCLESRMNFSLIVGKVRSLKEMDRLLMWAD